MSVPHGSETKRLVANIQNLTVSANNILEPQCFIREGVSILHAILQPPNWKVAVPETTAIFVRLSDHTVLGGVLHPWNSLVPAWVI